MKMFRNQIPLACLTSLAAILVSFGALAQTSPQGLSYQGRIVKPDGTSLEEAGVVFLIQVRSPGAEDCLLYEEQHTVNMSGSDGIFSLTIGGGTRSGGGFEDTSNLKQAFDNSSSALSSLTCASGSSYTPSSGDRRKIRISFTDSGGSHTVTQDQTVEAAPYALYADSLQGKTPSNFIQTISALEGTPGTTQSRFNRVINTDYATLDSLLLGTSTVYGKADGSNFTPSANIDFNSKKITGLADPSSAQDAATKNYCDAQIGGALADTSTLASLAAGDSGKVLTWNGSKWVAQAGSATDNTKLPLAGGTMTGAIAMGANDVTNVGYITQAAGRYLGLGSFTDATESTLVTGTLTPGGATYKGVAWYNSDSKTVKYWDGAAVVVLGSSSQLVGKNLAVPTATEDGKSVRWNDTAGAWEYFTPGSGSLTDVTATAPLVSTTSGATRALTINLGIGVTTVSNNLVVDFAPSTALGVATGTGKVVADDYYRLNPSTVLGDAGSMIRVTATGDGYELRTLAQVKSDLGLGTMATAASTDYLSKAGNLSGLADTTTARTNLGLGDAATKNVGTGAGSVAAGDDSRITGAVQSSGGTMTGALNLPTNGLVVGTTQLVTSGGKVGIGTASPGARLDVNGPYNGDWAIRAVNSDSGVAAAAVIQAASNNTSGVALKAFGSGFTGNVGGVAAANVAAMLTTAGTPPTHLIVGNQGNIPLYLMTNDAIRITVLGNGNLGVGTASPNELLTVEGVASLKESAAPTATANYGKIYVKSSDSKLYFMDDSGAETNLLSGSGGTVTSVSGTAPVQVATGTTTPVISVDAATTSTKGVVQVGTGLNVASGTVSVAYGTGSGKAVEGNDARLNPAPSSGDALKIPRINAGETGYELRSPAQVRGDISAAASGANSDITSLSGLTTPLSAAQGGLGVDASNVTANYVLAAPNGSAGAATFRALAAADLPTVTVAKGGTGRTSFSSDAVLITDSSGNPTGGVTCSTSGYTLQWNGTTWVCASANASGFVNGGNAFGANASLGTTDTFALNFVTDNATRMTIDSGGKVGIGTTSPVAGFDVENGDIFVGGSSHAAVVGTNYSSFNSGLGLAPANGDVTNFSALVTGTPNGTWGGDIQFVTRPSAGGAATEKMRVTAAGKVGIGTASPNYKLEVSDTDASTTLMIRNLDSASGHYPGLKIENYMGASGAGYPGITYANQRGTSASSTAIQSGDKLGVIAYWGGKGGGTGQGAEFGAIAAQNFANNAYGTTLYFSTTANNGSAPAERLRIDASGSVGVGTTNPNELLTVGGVTSLKETTAPTATANYGKLYVKSSDSKLYFMDDSGAEKDLTAGSSGSFSNVTSIANSGGGIDLTPSAGNSVIVNQTTTSTSPTTGALVVNGGAGIAGAVNVTGAVTSNTSVSAASSTAATSGANSNSPPMYLTANYWNGSATAVDKWSITNILGTGANPTSTLTFDHPTGTSGATSYAFMGGNVGIGTATPGTSLDIVGYGITHTYDGSDAWGSALHLRKIRGTSAVQNGDEVGYTNFDAYDGSAYRTVASIAAAIDGAPGANDTPGRIVFLTTPDGSVSPQERMRITNDGKVGIGTNSPATPLHVSTAGGDMMTVSNTNAGTTSIQMWSSTSSGGGAYIGDSGVKNSVGFNSTDKYVNIVSDDIERMRIDSLGHVGIGTTSPNELLTVEGVASLKETAAPTATANYGKLYVKSSDSKLYFMDDSGTEKDLVTGSSGALTGITDVTNASGGINLSPSAGNSVIVDQTTVSTSPTSGALVVNGGAGIAGAVNVSGAVTSNTSVSVASSTAATSGANSNSPPMYLTANYWNGSATAVDKWSITNILGTGTNPTSTLTFDHPTGTTGSKYYSFLNGRVGVGTSTPAGQLQVKGSADIPQLIAQGHSTQTSNIFEVRNSAGTPVMSVGNNGFIGSEDVIYAAWGFYVGTSNVYLRDAAGDILVLDSNGVQIPNGPLSVGTSTPISDLHVHSASGGVTETLSMTGTGGADQATLDFHTKGDGANGLGAASIKGWTMYARGNAWTTASEQNDFGFSYWNGTAWKTPLVMDSANGYVGIGTTAPNQTLTVEGVTSLRETTAPTATANYGKLYVKSSDSKLYFMDDSGVEKDLTSGGATGALSGITDVANSGGGINLTPSAGNSVIVNQTTSSTSSTTGALVVNGGAGIAGAMNVSGAVTSNTSVSVASSTAATSGANSNSPPMYLTANYWNGSATAVDKWSITNVLGSGANPTSTLTFDHPTGTTGTKAYSFMNGNIGVGTNSPWADILVERSDSSPYITVQNDSSTSQQWPGFSAYNYAGSVGGAPNLTLGTARGSDISPSAIQSGDYLGSINANGYGTSAWNDSIAQMYFVAEGNFTNASAPTAISFNTTPSGSTAATERMRINASGNVGIGTSSPAHALTIAKDDDTALQIQTSSTNQWTGIAFAESGGAKRAALQKNTDNSLAIWTATGSAGSESYSERFRVESSGKVGIGTNAPAQLLELKGSAGSPATSGTTQNGIFRIGQGTSNNVMDFGSIGSSPWTVWIQSANRGGLNTNNPLALNPNGGNVGVGTSNPGTTFEVYTATDDTGIAINRSSNASVGAGLIFKTAGSIKWSYMTNNDSTENLYLWNTGTSSFVQSWNAATGYIGIWNDSPSALLHVGNGSVTAGSAVAKFQTATGTCTMTPATSGTGIACSSDERLKKNVDDVSGLYALDRILQLQAVTYEFKKDPSETRHTGYIAQKVKDVAPEFVRKDEDGYYQIYYDGFIPWITESIKALYSKITSQDEKIEAVKQEKDREIASLKQKVDQLENQNAAIKAYLCSKDPKAAICQ